MAGIMTGVQRDMERLKDLEFQSDLSHTLSENELKLQSVLITLLENGKDRCFLLANQGYKRNLKSPLR